MATVARPLVKRIRSIFESIAYAGLQPGEKEHPKRRRRGPLNGPIDRFLSGGATPSDPFYLTNRTPGQKIRLGVLIGAPCLVIAFLVYGMLTGLFYAPAPAPGRDATPADVAGKMLPRVDPNMRVDNLSKDVEVMEVRVEHGPQTFLAGSMKNTTDHEIRTAEAIVDLTDSGGSALGAVSAKIEDFRAGAVASFRVPIQQNSAAFAIVRDIHAK